MRLKINRCNHRAMLAIALTAMCLLLNACGGGNSNPTPPQAPTPPPTSVTEPITWDQSTWDNSTWG
jgi:ABC-type glycerol-3-phosphate transport system substrate-binding protein